MATGHFGEPFFMDDPATLDDPFAALARYRDSCPVYHHAPLDQWFVFRYDDVAALLRDPRMSADRMRGFVDQAPAPVRDDLRSLAPMFGSWVLMMDGAAHARLRRFINLGFNATAVQALLPSVTRAADVLLDAAAPQGGMDVAADYGFLLPAYVLSDFMGVPEADRARIVAWSVDFVDFFNVFPITVDTATRMVRSAREMSAYTEALLAERRARPTDDFLGILARAADKDDGPNTAEIVGNAILLLLAGHVAVRNLIGNVVWLLLGDPQARAALVAEPARMPDAIEETLRYEPPVTLLPRIALADVVVAGTTIPRGAVVQLSLAAANRDPAHFAAPDRFDITRRHAPALSFGHGPHGCAGAHLARLETAIALERLFARFPAFTRDEGRPVRWYRTAANRGPTELALRFG